MSHLFLIFGSFYFVITNIGVILHHNLKTKDMKRLLFNVLAFIILGVSCFAYEDGVRTGLSLFLIITSSIYIIIEGLNEREWKI